MALSALDTLLWAAGIVGHAVLLAVLVLRHRSRQFPWFTSLIAAALLRSLVIPAVRGSERLYFNVYWLLAIPDVLLQLGVVYEVASHTFRPLGHWAPDARRGMAALIGVSLLLAAVITWLATPHAGYWQQVAVIRGSFFSSALMSELFVGMMVLSATVSLPWRTHVARIALALGIYSLVDVVIEAAHTLYGRAYQAHVDDVLSESRKVLYLLCVGWWVVSLWRKAPTPRALPEEARKHLRSLQTRLAYDLYTFRNWRR